MQVGATPSDAIVRRSSWDSHPRRTDALPATVNLHWIIEGGESGRGARPMEKAWVEDLRDQCARARSVLLQTVGRRLQEARRPRAGRAHLERDAGTSAAGTADGVTQVVIINHAADAGRLTKDPVINTLGQPHEVQQTVTNGKATELWHYFDGQRRRTKANINLEDGVVTGWTVKD